MSRHRLEPARRVRPRYGRIAAAGLSMVVTMVALLGGVGLIPLQTARHGAEAPAGDDAPVSARTGVTGENDDSDPLAAAAAEAEAGAATSRSRSDRGVGDALATVAEATPDESEALPAGSGSGRRVVFSESAQRVWLVAADGTVESTYLVSGSVTDNLQPGSYEVYSRSRWAVGIDDSGAMEYFVRFTRGQHAAIGFHSIPTKGGEPLQTEAQLGTPQSHGCIRQRLSDAQRMWDFADLGTDVVVVA